MSDTTFRNLIDALYQGIDNNNYEAMAKAVMAERSGEVVAALGIVFHERNIPPSRRLATLQAIQKAIGNRAPGLSQALARNEARLTGADRLIGGTG